jgi:hypothetical protein
MGAGCASEWRPNRAKRAIFRGPDSWEFIRGPGLGKLAGGGPCIGSDPCGRADAEAPTLHMPNYPTRKAETGEIAGDGKAYFLKLKELIILMTLLPLLHFLSSSQ